MPFETLPWDKILEIAGFLIGLLYLWWEYHADSRLWLASIIMPAISMWIYFRKGIYADFAINIYYFLIAIYGYIVWTRHKRPDKAKAKDSDKSALPIRHLSGGVALGCLAVFAGLWALLWSVLHYFTDSTIPLADAFTTALSIVASWMLARKYIEQWIAWIIVDAVCVGLYIYKGIPIYGLLYAIYTIIAFFGYRKWARMMRAAAES